MLQDFSRILKKKGFSKSYSKYGMSLYRKRYSEEGSFEIGVILTSHYPKYHLIEVEVGLYCASIEAFFAEVSGVSEQLGALWLTFGWKSAPFIQWNRVNDELYTHTLKESQIKFLEDNVKNLSDSFNEISIESIKCIESMTCNAIFMSFEKFRDNISRYAIYYIIFNYNKGKRLEELFEKASHFIAQENPLQYESFIINYSLFSNYVAKHSIKAGFLEIE